MSTGTKIALGAVGFIAALIIASVVWFKTHLPIGLDPYGCFGAGRYDAMRDGRVCPGWEHR